MSYREKLAWLSLFAIVITFGPYFALAVLSPPADSLPNLNQLVLYAKASLAQMVIIGLGYWALKKWNSDDARQAPDERDRLIDYRATKVAYYALFAGMIVVGGIMPFYEHGWKLVNSALFTMTIAQVLYYGMIALAYRRQS